MNKISLAIEHRALVLAWADAWCDKIPVLSTITNLVNLVAKPILQYTGTKPTLGGKSWSERIHQKPVWKCLLLCLPVLGNLIVYFMPKHNYTQESIDQLFGISNAYEQLPELILSNDKELFIAKKFTAPVMKGKLEDGRQFIAIKLKHEAEAATEPKPENMSEKDYRFIYPQYFDCEKVYAIFQKDCDRPNIWCGDNDHQQPSVCPSFFSDIITDFDDGHVRGFEQEPYALLQALIKNGEGKDYNGKMWKLPDHDKLLGK